MDSIGFWGEQRRRWRPISSRRAASGIDAPSLIAAKRPRSAARTGWGGSSFTPEQGRVLRDTGWAMSEENVEIVRRAYEAFNRGTAAWLALREPDWEVLPTATGPKLSRFRSGGCLGVLRPGLRSVRRISIGDAEIIDAGTDKILSASDTMRVEGERRE